MILLFVGVFYCQKKKKVKTEEIFTQNRSRIFETINNNKNSLVIDGYLWKKIITLFVTITLRYENY